MFERKETRNSGIQRRGLCVMTKQVQSPEDKTSCKAWCTARSDRKSRAEVASSKISIRGFRANARAMQTRCFCPPLSAWPLSPASVSIPSGRKSANSLTCAMVAASLTASWFSSDSSCWGPELFKPYSTFCRMLMANNVGSWLMTPSCDRTQVVVLASENMSWPSTRIRPEIGS